MKNKSDVIAKLIESCVECAPSGVWYVTPMWREDECLHDYDGDYDELLEVLKLTVDKKNAIDNKVKPVIDWLYKLMTETVDTQLNEFEADLMNGALHYLLQKSPTIPKQEDGWSFAKRGS